MTISLWTEGTRRRRRFVLIITALQPSLNLSMTTPRTSQEGCLPGDMLQPTETLECCPYKERKLYCKEILRGKGNRRKLTCLAEKANRGLGRGGDVTDLTNKQLVAWALF